MEALLRGRDTVVLDGGLATRLEEYGCDLSGGLWSARLLADAPGLVRRVHRDFFDAGADVAVSASYQASFTGFAERGIGRDEAAALMLRSVRLAAQARDEAGGGLVAAGIGPYGAALADGAEYTGDYALDAEALADWHRERWHLLAGSGADLLACETVPSVEEAHALAALMEESPEVPVWVSFSGRDDAHISDGTPIAECAALFGDRPQVVAVGVNCTPPRHVASLVAAAVAASGRPGVAYPNSGESWDARARAWTGTADPEEFASGADGWRAAGARLIGGCCRTGPGHIRRIRAHIG
ncbi:homocysteine S-methyltransferase [Nocardiopsis suaedae]|uniref:Homocysteine S-methyltransferase n=1 Tax=Nocardiopsis suaedae TaxID=3018444 RepID=A0ABT4TIQ8_9ACTN|nr:homocysteine S-methyltransferase [Nocardiopsis suaedae]MDA2803997.1 homocysteine S-methyltransferase [Nocardiopsis suaedae]